MEIKQTENLKLSVCERIHENRKLSRNKKHIWRDIKENTKFDNWEVNLDNNDFKKISKISYDRKNWLNRCTCKVL